jgi:hypothetical protein
MKLTVRTRSADAVLYEKMRALIPESIECVPHTAYDDWKDAATFLHDAIEMTSGLLVVCDEDCFITDWEAVYKLAKKVEDEDFLFCGIPDGGDILHRCFSWCAANPSFVIFNTPLIKSWLKNSSRTVIDGRGYVNYDMEKHKPTFLLGAYNNGNHEPFNGLFYTLVGIGEPLYIHGETLGDGLSTAIKGLDGKTIAVHTWMSRDKSPENRQRIERAYQYALSITNHD